MNEKTRRQRAAYNKQHPSREQLPENHRYNVKWFRLRRAAFAKASAYVFFGVTRRRAKGYGVTGKTLNRGKAIDGLPAYRFKGP
jgi:hypothetical protein